MFNVRKKSILMFWVFFMIFVFSANASRLPQGLWDNDLAAVPELICVVITEISITPNVELQIKGKIVKKKLWNASLWNLNTQYLNLIIACVI